MIATPINLGSGELVSINKHVGMIENTAGVKLKRHYDPDAPLGVAGRNSDNAIIRQGLNWEPNTPLQEGLRKTYAWIQGQYSDRKSGIFTSAGRH